MYVIFYAPVSLCVDGYIRNVSDSHNIICCAHRVVGIILNLKIKVTYALYEYRPPVIA